MKYSITIDGSGNTKLHGSLSIYTSGGNNSLFFGQDQIPAVNNPDNFGKWGLMYVPPSMNNGVGGLNFWIPYIPNYNNFGNGYMWLSDNGNVGIGTTKPGATLDVEGVPSQYTTLLSTADATNTYDIMASLPSANANQIGLAVHIAAGSQNYDVFDVYGNGNTYVAGTITANGDPNSLWTSNTGSPYSPATLNMNGGWVIPLTIPSGGAIRTAAPGSLGRYLGFGMVDANNGTSTTGWYWIIQGDASSSTPACYPMTLLMDQSGNATITLSQNSWRDYIFSPDYKRMTIEEKEQFYITNKHLPGIDPASVVEKKGLNVNKNLLGILQNEEEDRLDITSLYKIIQQQQKEIEKLENEVDTLKK